MFMCRRRRGLKSNDDLNSAGPPKLLLTLAAWLRVRVGDADNSEEAVVASATQRVPPYSLRFQKGFPGLPVPNLKLSRSAHITTPKIKAAALLRCVGSACDIVAPGISGCGVASISAACAGSASSTNKGIATVKWAGVRRGDFCRGFFLKNFTSVTTRSTSSHRPVTVPKEAKYNSSTS